MKIMNKYLEILKISYLSEYSYRANVIFSILRNSIVLFISINIWQALYGTKTTVNGIALSEMLNYLVITFFIRELTRSDIADTITAKIRSGAISTDFILPVSFFFNHIFEQMGKNLFNLVFSILPICMIAYFFFQFKIALSTHLLLFIPSAILATILMLLISYTFSLFAFWFKSALFVRALINALLEIFAGAAVPLWFYPPWFFEVSMFLPFRLIFFSPVSIFLGKLSPAEALEVLGLQAFWIVLFFGLERLVWHRAQKIVTVQGG
jgi:ABC-2 type transport system permease protein